MCSLNDTCDVKRGRIAEGIAVRACDAAAACCHARCAGGRAESHVGPGVGGGPHGKHFVRFLAAASVADKVAQGVDPVGGEVESTHAWHVSHDTHARASHVTPYLC